MIPAKTSKRFFGETKLMVINDEDKIYHSTVGDIVDYLQPNDLLVVNQSGTLPSSFRGYIQRTNEPIEIRLAAFQGSDTKTLENWLAFSFGSGNWTIPTEERGIPPTLQIGDKIIFGDELAAEIIEVQHQRLLRICFIGGNITKALYKYGRPIQYSYLTEELQVWDQQTIFGTVPISVEPPSAAFPFSWDLMLKLKAKNVDVAYLLHSAGISSTGSKDLDKLLPLAEWYEIPEQTAYKVNKAKKEGRKVIAFGTTVLRAMESAWKEGKLESCKRLTTLKITPDYKIKSATALLTGMHEIETSHMNILYSFCPIQAIKNAYKQAEEIGYRGHEYGDISLVDCYFSPTVTFSKG